MKKILGIALVSAVLLSCAVTPAFASDTIDLPELKMRVEMPDGWIVLTRNMSADDPNFALMGTDKETNDKYLEEKDFYMDAKRADGSEEIIVVSTPSTPYDVYDLDLLSETELDDLMQEVVDNLSGYYAVVEDSFYETEQATYLRIDVNDLDGEGRKRYCREYGTFIDGMNTVFVYICYDNPFTPAQEAVFKSVVDSAVFAGRIRRTPVPAETAPMSMAVTTAPDKEAVAVPGMSADAVMGLCIGFGGLAIVAVLLFVTVRCCRRSATKDTDKDGYDDTYTN
jgi:hypothetical protein